MNQIIKSTNLHTGKLQNGDLELINKLTIEPLTENDVFTFSMTLCSNEIDRDFESFTTQTIKKLESMFIGKTGIFNHKADAKNQAARIFKTSIKNTGELTCFGQPKIVLEAKAYTLKCNAFNDLITAIKGGILKEISISCQIGNKICSICEKDLEEGCIHEKQKMYNNKLCYVKLTNPIDAYEWSFVPIPAQKCAQITKTYDSDTLEKLKAAEIGQMQKLELCQQIIKLGFLCGFGETKQKYFKNIVKKLNFEELQNLKTDLEKILNSNNFKNSLTKTIGKNNNKAINNKQNFLEYLI